jgi:hypothetical protein
MMLRISLRCRWADDNACCLLSGGCFSRVNAAACLSVSTPLPQSIICSGNRNAVACHCLLLSGRSVSLCLLFPCNVLLCQILSLPPVHSVPPIHSVLCLLPANSVLIYASSSGAMRTSCPCGSSKLSPQSPPPMRPPPLRPPGLPAQIASQTTPQTCLSGACSLYPLSASLPPSFSASCPPNLTPSSLVDYLNTACVLADVWRTPVFGRVSIFASYEQPSALNSAAKQTCCFLSTML